mmetsp:Transcript_26875/g.76252  ORF Transcript_26875/g.76252 Transcript_26875/m.76252 type:complete len:234 (+) Transcript_26875:566-1267(+)
MHGGPRGDPSVAVGGSEAAGVELLQHRLDVLAVDRGQAWLEGPLAVEEQHVPIGLRGMAEDLKLQRRPGAGRLGQLGECFRGAVQERGVQEPGLEDDLADRRLPAVPVPLVPLAAAEARHQACALLVMSPALEQHFIVALGVAAEHQDLCVHREPGRHVLDRWVVVLAIRPHALPAVLARPERAAMGRRRRLVERLLGPRDLVLKVLHARRPPAHGLRDIPGRRQDVEVRGGG